MDLLEGVEDGSNCRRLSPAGQVLQKADVHVCVCVPVCLLPKYVSENVIITLMSSFCVPRRYLWALSQALILTGRKERKPFIICL